MKKVFGYFKKEMMLTVSLLAAVIGLLITPPGADFFAGIDWRTLGTLLMMLCVLEGFKKENVLRPVENLASKLGTVAALSLFLIFGVFFTSMFVTNDVSLIIFVPLTILLFRSGECEQYILPVISMENIAAIRGSLLTPFGSPQNLFLYGQAKEIGFLHFRPYISIGQPSQHREILTELRRDAVQFAKANDRDMKIRSSPVMQKRDCVQQRFKIPPYGINGADRDETGNPVFGRQTGIPEPVTVNGNQPFIDRQFICQEKDMPHLQ